MKHRYYILFPKIHISVACVLISVLMCCCSSNIDAVPSIYDYKISDKIEVDMDSAEYVLIKSIKQFSSLFKNKIPDYKKIDFKTYNLLYIQGKSANSIADIQSSCVATENEIRVNIEIKNLLTSEYCNWNQAFLIPKAMNDNISISVSMTQ